MWEAKQQSRSWKSWTTNLEAQSNFIHSQKSSFKLNVSYIQAFNQQIVQENMTVHKKKKKSIPVFSQDSTIEVLWWVEF